jgi:Mn2+/Fe2+ NRAMP family transporter
MCVLIVSALVLAPQHIHVDSYHQAALMFVPVFKRYAVPLFAAALGVGCLGAAVEISLNAGYVLSQGFGWTWGANKKRLDTTRFTLAMTIMLAASVLFGLVGIDPLRLTLISMGITVVVMPIVVLPFLVVMNDERFVKTHRSGPIGNGVLATLVVAGAILALIVVPLEIVGGG